MKTQEIGYRTPGPERTLTRSDRNDANRGTSVWAATSVGSAVPIRKQRIRKPAQTCAIAQCRAATTRTCSPACDISEERKVSANKAGGMHTLCKSRVEGPQRRRPPPAARRQRQSVSSSSCGRNYPIETCMRKQCEMIITSSNDEIGCERWLSKNPSGFVFNHFGGRSSGDDILHYASCVYLHRTADEGHRTVYEKRVCSDLGQLIEHVDRLSCSAGGWKMCGVCSPRLPR